MIFLFYVKRTYKRGIYTMTISEMKVERRTFSLRQMVVEKLRSAIVDGTFEPGTRLIERELCASLEVSRPLLREALSQLEAEGLIQIIPYRGPIVADFSDAETISIYQVRAVLEEMAGRMFVANATAKEHKDLEDSLRFIEEGYRSTRGHDRLAMKSEFYLILATGAHCPMLVELLRVLHSRATWLRRATLNSPGRIDTALKEMHQIVRLIQDGKAVEAGKACRQHVLNALAIAEKILAERQVELATNQKPDDQNSCP